MAEEGKILAEKILDEELATLDRSDMGVAQVEEPGADVEGQHGGHWGHGHHGHPAPAHWGPPHGHGHGGGYYRVECPWCGRRVFVRPGFRWQECGHCGRGFRLR